jgi:hypothetical protein
MRRESEPTGADAVFVVVCLLMIAAWFVAIMLDVTYDMACEALARMTFRG